MSDNSDKGVRTWDGTRLSLAAGIGLCIAGLVGSEFHAQLSAQSSVDPSFCLNLSQEWARFSERLKQFPDRDNSLRAELRITNKGRDICAQNFSADLK